MAALGAWAAGEEPGAAGAAPGGSQRRRRKTAAERRQQTQRAEARRLLWTCKVLADVNMHRGSTLGPFGDALLWAAKETAGRRMQTRARASSDAPLAPASGAESPAVDAPAVGTVRVDERAQDAEPSAEPLVDEPPTLWNLDKLPS